MSEHQDESNSGTKAANTRVFSIPPTSPFLETLVTEILSGSLPIFAGSPPDPLALSRVTLLFPSRRACRAAELAFLEKSDGAVMLPRIKAIADVVESRLLALGLIPSLPPAISDLERQLVLSELVRKWSQAWN